VKKININNINASLLLPIANLANLIKSTNYKLNKKYKKLRVKIKNIKLTTNILLLYNLY
jgi:hypothetical protein